MKYHWGNGEGELGNERLVSLGGFLPGDGLLFTHRADDGDEHVFAVFKGL